MRVIRGQSKALLVAEELERYIQIQGLVENQRLGTKESLQREFGVARATINEAVKILNDRGRITAKSGPGGGLFITTPDAGVQMGRFLVSVERDLKNVSHAMELRDYLEFLLVRHAAEYRTEGDISDLWKVFSRLGKTRGNITAQIEAVWALHERIAEITPNATLRATYHGLLAYIRDNVAEKSSAPREEQHEFFERRITSHRHLIEAIEVGDVKAVEVAVREHNDT